MDFKRACELKTACVYSSLRPASIHALKLIHELKGFVLLFTREFFILTLQYPELRSYLLDNIIYQNPDFVLPEEIFQHLGSIFINMENEAASGRKYSQNIIRNFIYQYHTFLKSFAFTSRLIPLNASQDRGLLAC